MFETIKEYTELVTFANAIYYLHLARVNPQLKKQSVCHRTGLHGSGWSMDNHYIDGHPVQINALSVVNPATGLSKFTHIRTKEARHITRCYENNWLERHRRLLCCIHDNGAEFNG